MLPLADLQRDFAHAILSGGAAPNLGFARGPVCVQTALRVHRNTVMGALSNALRLTFPSVDRLVGNDFFDQCAAIFAESRPPAAAHLAAYGEGFPDFLESHVPTIPCLADVARLDLAIDRGLQGAPAVRSFALSDSVALEFPASLSLLKLLYPAEQIKDALEDDAALEMIDLAPTPRCLAVWRTGRQAWVRSLSVPAAEFLGALLSGDSFEAAFAAASGDASAPDVLEIIQAEIFSAPFCQVISQKRIEG